MAKLYIVMVGLPARGKSTLAMRLLEGFSGDSVPVKIFNNGEIRRSYFGPESSEPDFFSPTNQDAYTKRKYILKTTAYAAKEYLEAGGGEIAIIDATNSNKEWREFLESILDNAPILYIECVINEPELISAVIERKIKLPEFASKTKEEARESFRKRIAIYENNYIPLRNEKHYFCVDTLTNTILFEKDTSELEHSIRVRDILISDWIRKLFLARHGESIFNTQNRIGGDSSLTQKGIEQANALSDHFLGQEIPYIFSSKRARSLQTIEPIKLSHPESKVISISEFDELDAGICDSMTYEEISKNMPGVHKARTANKYYYTYPKGEGYASMLPRVSLGLQKALFISGGLPGILIVGHQAVNRMILSLFLFRRKENVPYIYVPQDQYYHIEVTHRKKLFELVSFMNGEKL